MTANIAILDNMEYWPKPLHLSLEFLYQDRQKKQKHTIGASGPGGYGPAGGPFHCGG